METVQYADGVEVIAPDTFRRRERNSLRALDIRPSSMDEKLQMMRRWTPDRQLDHVTELLVQSNAGLLVAVAAQDLPGIAEIKAKAAGIEKIAKQLRIADDMQQHATEFVRRAERGLGVAIREGQDRGEVARRGQGAAVIPPGAKRDRRDKDILLPSNLASKSELQGQTGADGIYAMTDGVSDEQFEEALAEARAEGNLSRANVARKCKAKAQHKEPIDADDPLIDAAVEPEPEKPAPAPQPVMPRPFKKSDTEMLAEIVGSLANFADLMRYIRPDQIEHKEAVRLADQAASAIGSIRKHLKGIRNVTA